MAIKFSCPNCGKALSVKDQLAGKRGACSGCKKVITIPYPVAAAHHEDVEALALQAFADEAAAVVPVADTRTIDFTCPMCDEPVKVGFDLGGKQTPCPACRRIVKVPMPVKSEPKDWRKIQTGGPSMAKRETEPAPEGAWGSTTSTAGVSRQALLETGAIIEEPDEDLGRQRLMRLTLAGIGVVAVALVGFGVMSFLGRGKADKLMARALDAANAESSGLTAEQSAVVHWGAGEYLFRTGAPDAAQKASEQFQLARGALARSASLERDVMLGELAGVLIDCGGEKADADKGTALEWGKALEGARQALEQIRAPEARLEAARLVTRKLAGKGQARAAQSLAGRLSSAAPGKPGEATNEHGELIGVVALELLRSGNDKEAQALADSFTPVKPPIKGAEGRTSPVAPALVALSVKLDRPKPAIRKTGKPGEEKENPDDLENMLLGTAEGAARAGNAAQARQLLSAARPLTRLKGLLALATLAADAGGRDNPDLTAALDLAETEAKGASPSAWLPFRLAQLAAENGQADRARQLAAQIPDAGLKAQVQLANLRERLKATKDKLDPALADEVADKSGARARAWLLVTRHNAPLDNGTAKAVEALDEPRRVTGLVGAALGTQDGKR